MTWTIAGLARRFGVSKTTIRNYARRFVHHFSPGVQVQAGEARQFDDSDVYVIAAIVRYTSQGLTYDDIDDLLASGAHYLEDIEIPPEPVTSEQVAIQRFEQMQLAYVTLQDERNQLIQRLEELARDAGRADELRRDRDALLDRVQELTLALGQLQGQMGQVQRSWWRRLFG